MSAAEALAPEQSVDEVRESLSVTEKGQPANTIGNCRTVFCHDPLLRLSLIHISGKQTDTLAMKSMREDLKAVERLRKTAEQLSRQERDKPHDREPER